VAPAVRAFKIRLNDSNWSSNEARARGLRSLAIAQLGSDGLDSQVFAKKLAEKTIKNLLPDLADKLQVCKPEADECRATGSADSARKLAQAFATCTPQKITEKLDPDYYLLMSSELALEVLREMDAPGVKLWDEVKNG
jgi:uncharacterized membrane protein